MSFQTIFIIYYRPNLFFSMFDVFIQNKSAICRDVQMIHVPNQTTSNILTLIKRCCPTRCSDFIQRLTTIYIIFICKITPIGAKQIQTKQNNTNHKYTNKMTKPWPTTYLYGSKRYIQNTLDSKYHCCRAVVAVIVRQLDLQLCNHCISPQQL